MYEVSPTAGPKAGLMRFHPNGRLEIQNAGFWRILPGTNHRWTARHGVVELFVDDVIADVKNVGYDRAWIVDGRMLSATGEWFALRHNWI